MKTTILIADDDPVQRRLLENTVSKMGHRVVLAEDGKQAVDALSEDRGSEIGLVILDLVMPELDGMGVLDKMREMGLTNPTIVQTSKGSIETVVNAMRSGAVDFVVKPVSPERLSVSIQNALKIGAMADAVQKIKKTASGTFTFDDMIADSPVMQSVIKLGRRCAASNIPVLIEGESGVGKEVIARAIQGSSERSSGPFVAVNCGALPENLAESILFGHEKGSFTGATHAHAGKFKEADGGTLFLDEVGELPLDLQVKLLRVLQEGEVDPIGSKRPTKVDVRIISATNRDMMQQVKSGEFREDLYYRLSVFPISVPPLRERKSDIAELARYFCARICLEEGRANINGIGREALALLEEYDWTGNVRQLENTIFRAIVLCDGDMLDLEDFPQITQSLGVDVQPTRSSESPADNLKAAPASSSNAVVDILNESGDLRPIAEVESDVINFAIKHHDWRMTRIARGLGIGRSTLYRKLKEYGLEDHPSN